jgi:ligand-binding SRPBCC domain-containing protein
MYAWAVDTISLPVADLVQHMTINILILVRLLPAGERWSADHYLTSWPRQLFPAHFSDVLHPFPQLTASHLHQFA